MNDVMQSRLRCGGARRERLEAVPLEQPAPASAARSSREERPDPARGSQPPSEGSAKHCGAQCLNFTRRRCHRQTRDQVMRRIQARNDLFLRRQRRHGNRHITEALARALHHCLTGPERAFLDVRSSSRIAQCKGKKSWKDFRPIGLELDEQAWADQTCCRPPHGDDRQPDQINRVGARHEHAPSSVADCVASSSGRQIGL